MESMDVIRLDWKSPPLDAQQLRWFFGNSTREYNEGGYYAVSSAFNFYEKNGTTHFVYRLGAASGGYKPKDRVYDTREYDGTYHARTTEAGEEWVRCSKRLPHRPWRGYNGRTIMLDPDDLERSWIDCGANRHGDDPFGFEGRVAEREDAATAPPGTVVQTSDDVWRVAGADAYERSPAEAKAEEKVGVSGLPLSPATRDAITGRYSPAQRCFRGESVTVGGSPHACDQAGYERSLPDGTVRRYVTPTWDNSNNWTHNMYEMSMIREGGPDAGGKLQFDTSPAYPNTLFIGGHTECKGFVYYGSTRSPDNFDHCANGVRYLTAWEYLWKNPEEVGSSLNPPALDASAAPTNESKKYILGRWREPQLPWSLPRNFQPKDFIGAGVTKANCTHSAMYAGIPNRYSTEGRDELKRRKKLCDAHKFGAGVVWDPPTITSEACVGDATLLGNDITDSKPFEPYVVSSYVYPRTHVPVYQDSDVGLPKLVPAYVETTTKRRLDWDVGRYVTWHENITYNGGTTTIDWNAYYAPAAEDVVVGNLWHIGEEFRFPDADGEGGDTQPLNAEDVPAGGFPVKGSSLYMNREGKLVLVAVDRGKTPTVKTCTSSMKIEVDAWTLVTVSVDETKATLRVGEREACSVTLPHGPYALSDGCVPTPVYSQCRTDDCAGVGDHSRKHAAPHAPASVRAEMFDFTIAIGDRYVKNVAGASAARVAFTPPHPDAWKKRCRPDCPDPNVFFNHVPIPQGRWTRVEEPRSLKLYGCRGGTCEDPNHCCRAEGKNCYETRYEWSEHCGHSSAKGCGYRGSCRTELTKAMGDDEANTGEGGTWRSSFKVNARGDVSFMMDKVYFLNGKGEVEELESSFWTLRGAKSTCDMTGLCGDDFANASLHGIFEKRDDGVAHWRKQTKRAKENSKESDMYHSALGQLVKTGDHEDILVIKDIKIFTWHPEKKTMEGGWSTQGMNIRDELHDGKKMEVILSGRSITHYNPNFGTDTDVYGWAQRRMLDSENYVQRDYMPLGESAHPSPYICATWRSLFSPDGGYTYYGVLVSGYDPKSEPISRCHFGRKEGVQGKNALGRQFVLGIRRLVTDECKPLISRNTDVGFASYVGTTRGSNTKFRGGISNANGDFLFSGTLGAPELLGTNASHARIDLTSEATGCAANADATMPFKFNETAGGKCMSQVVTFQGKGCFAASSQDDSCGALAKSTFLGSGGAGDMARAIVEGSVVVVGPPGVGVMKLNEHANVTIWNACAQCEKSERTCDILCSTTREPGAQNTSFDNIRVDVGPQGSVVAVLRGNVVIVLDAATGTEMYRNDIAAGRDVDRGIVVSDVAVSDAKHIRKVFVGGYKKSIPVDVGGCPTCLPGVQYVDVAFVRAYDADTGALSFKTWDYEGSDMGKFDAAHTRIKRMIVDKSGRLFVGADVSGYKKTAPKWDYPTNDNFFRYDGGPNGTVKAALAYQSRPRATVKQPDSHASVDGSAEFGPDSAAYVALIDPFTGLVARGQHLFSRSSKKCYPRGRKNICQSAIGHVTLEAIDVDAKGNIIIAGQISGIIKNRDYNTVNNVRIARQPGIPPEAEPYFAIFDANLIQRLKWSTLSQKTSWKPGGQGSAAVIVGGSYCPDNTRNFGSCTSAVLLTGVVTRNMGQFYTMANALQVMGEGTKKGSARGCLRNGYRYKSGAEYRADLERTDCHKTDAYAALIQGPPQIGDFSVCNPLDFREPPVDLLWARFVNAKKSIDLKFDANSDRGETGELTLGGIFPCSELINVNASANLGEGCLAYFLDKRTVRISLGDGHEATEASDGIADGSVITIRGGVIYSDKFRDRGRSTTASIQVTRHPGEKVAVHARVKCFHEFINIDWGCFVPTIDCTASESTGDLGGNLTFKWSLERTPITGRGADAKEDALRSYLGNLTSTSRSISIPSSIYVPLLGSRRDTLHMFTFSVIVSNKKGHVYTGEMTDVNAQRKEASAALTNTESGFVIEWAKMNQIPPGRVYSMHRGLAGVKAAWRDCGLESRNAETERTFSWKVTPMLDDRSEIETERVAGWPTPTGIHPEVTYQETKLVELFAMQKTSMFSWHRNMMFAGRKYVIECGVTAFWNGAHSNNTGGNSECPAGWTRVNQRDRTTRSGCEITKTLRWTTRTKYGKIKSIAFGGNGGEYAEYAKAIAPGEPLDPFVNDQKWNKPSLLFNEVLPRRQVRHDEKNEVHAVADQRIDPDWRTDVEVMNHQWYCTNYVSDREDCGLAGLSVDLGGDVKLVQGRNYDRNLREQDKFWPPPAKSLDVDELPEGTPLRLPANSMHEAKEYTFTLMSTKTKRDSFPDMTVLLTTYKTCPTATIEPIHGRVNTQFLFRIYGNGASVKGDVYFRWSLVDAHPLDAATLKKPETTNWLDKAYFSIAKNTMVPGREYVLKLFVTTDKNDPDTCIGEAERLLLTNTPPRAIDGITFDPPDGGIEFNTSYTIECGSWVDDGAEALEYRLAFWYDFDVYKPRWAWLTDRQKGMSTFRNVFVPHSPGSIDTKVRCVAYDADGAFGVSAGAVKVEENSNLGAALEGIFNVGNHMDNVHVFPAALRRLQQQDKARHKERARRSSAALLGESLPPRPDLEELSSSLKTALQGLKTLMSQTPFISISLRDAALELVDTYVATSELDDAHARSLPAADILEIIARTAHDWPDGVDDASEPPDENGELGDGTWSALMTAYGRSTARHGTDKVGVSTSRVLRGSAAADASNDEVCNAPLTKRVVTVDGKVSSEKLFARVTYSGTPSGYHEQLASGSWPSEIPKFNVTGRFRSSDEVFESVAVETPIPDAKPIVGGCAHFCVIANGDVVCWGQGEYGQLGTGSVSNVGNAPGEMGDKLKRVPLGSKATQLASGCQHTCALTDDGKVMCWGRNQYGQLGVGADVGEIGADFIEGNEITAVDLGTGMEAIQIVAGLEHTCALLSDRSVKCWGRNNKGQLGQEEPPSKNRGTSPMDMGDDLPPIKVMGKGSKGVVTRLFAGSEYTCAVIETDSGRGECTLDCDYITTEEAKCYVNRYPDLRRAFGHNIGAAKRHWNKHGKKEGRDKECDSHKKVKSSKAKFKCWGGNEVCRMNVWRDWSKNNKNYGDRPGSMGENLDFVHLTRPVKQLALSQRLTCAILESEANAGEDELVCWGEYAKRELPGRFGVINECRDGHYKQLPFGKTAYDLTSISDSGDRNATYPVQIDGGHTHICVTMSDGNVRCICDSQLNTATVMAYRQKGFKLYADFSDPIVCGYGDVSPRKKGEDWAEGSPPVVDLGGDVAFVVAGGTSNCAMLRSGVVKCWGQNFAGQLGVGDAVAVGNSSKNMGANLPAVSLPPGVPKKQGTKGFVQERRMVTPTNVKSDLCATFSAGAIPSAAFAKCPDSTSVENCGLPFVVSESVAFLSIVDDFSGQIDYLHSLRSSVTLRVDERYRTLVSVNEEEETDEEKSAVYCAVLHTVSAEGAGSAAEEDILWRDDDCVVTRAEGDASVYTCTCKKLGAVALALRPERAEDWKRAGSRGRSPSCFDGVLNGAETGVDCGGDRCSPCALAATATAQVAPSAAAKSEGTDFSGSTPTPTSSEVDDDATSVTTTYAITGMSAAKADAQLNFVENVLVKSRLSRGITFHALATTRVSAEKSADGASATLVLKFTGFVGKDPRGVKRFSQMSAGPRTMRATNAIMKKRGSLVVAANHRTDSVISWSDAHERALRGRIGGLIRRAKAAVAVGDGAARAKFARGIRYFKALLNGPSAAPPASLGAAKTKHATIRSLPIASTVATATVVAAVALFVVVARRRRRRGRGDAGGAEEEAAFVVDAPAEADYGSFA